MSSLASILGGMRYQITPRMAMGLLGGVPKLGRKRKAPAKAKKAAPKRKAGAKKAAPKRKAAAKKAPAKRGKGLLGGKVPVQLREWHHHVAEVRKAHPNMAYKDVLKLASKSYRR